jgi:hypothetical protein
MLRTSVLDFNCSICAADKSDNPWVDLSLFSNAENREVNSSVRADRAELVVGCSAGNWGAELSR